MNNPKEIIKDVSKQLATSMIKHDMTGWPPDCLMFAYQPIRPIPQKDNIERRAYESPSTISHK